MANRKDANSRLAMLELLEGLGLDDSSSGTDGKSTKSKGTKEQVKFWLNISVPHVDDEGEESFITVTGIDWMNQREFIRTGGTSVFSKKRRKGKRDIDELFDTLDPNEEIEIPGFKVTIRRVADEDQLDAEIDDEDGDDEVAKLIEQRKKRRSK